MSSHVTSSKHSWMTCLLLDTWRMCWPCHWSLKLCNAYIFSLAGLTPDRLGPPSHDASPLSPEPMTPEAQSPSQPDLHDKAEHKRFSVEVCRLSQWFWIHVLPIEHQLKTVTFQVNVESLTNHLDVGTTLFSWSNASPRVMSSSSPLPAQLGWVTSGRFYPSPKHQTFSLLEMWSAQFHLS